MWKELKVNDIEDLEKYSNNVNDTYCGTKVGWESSVNWLQNILKWKREASCFMYEDEDFKITLMTKYNPTVDRIVVFQFFIKFYKPITNTDKLYEVLAENCKLLLERYSKIVRVPKYSEYAIDRDVGIDNKENTKRQTIVYNKAGIKVIDFKKYWEYELM